MNKIAYSQQERELLKIDERFKKLKIPCELTTNEGNFTKAILIVKGEKIVISDFNTLKETLVGYEKANSQINRNPELKKLLKNIR